MKSILRKFFVVLLFGWSSMAAADHPAQTLVVETVDGLLSLIQTEGDRIANEPEYLRQQLEERVVPHIDFSTMTRRAIGKNWKKASADQRKVLVSEYKEFLLNTYTGAVSEYKGGTVEYDRFRPEKREDIAYVRSRFKQAGSADVPVVYKLQNKKDKWRIWDIEVSQLSLVTNNRSFFSSEIERNGIDGLIKLLKDKNQ